jgi:hypothetical protein
MTSTAIAAQAVEFVEKIRALASLKTISGLQASKHGAISAPDPSGIAREQKIAEPHGATLVELTSQMLVLLNMGVNLTR